MSVGEFLKVNTARLHEAGINTARLDCLVLLSDILNTNSAHVLAHLGSPLTNRQQHALERAIQRRTAHEPLAYIRNTCDFFGRSFYINRHTLVPRPESESMIELLQEMPALPGETIIDVGTGSGSLAITAKLERPQATVIGLDISTRSLAAAKRNAVSLNADVRFMQSNLLKSLPNHQPAPVTLLCNLPYVPTSYLINRAATYEPPVALFGGVDGLTLYRRFFTQLDAWSAGAVCAITESLTQQHEALATMAKKHRFRLSGTNGLAQRFTR